MKEDTIALLNKDLQDEHGAIIQYLIHAYAIGEGALACEIEAISREEMRHFDYLARAIVELGGTPTLDRGKMRLEGAAVADWMKNDAQIERDAIVQYEAHIKAIGDRKVKRLLERILSDEKAHAGMFREFVSKSAKDGMKDLRGARDDRLAQVLNWGIEHEYTAVLQYLFQRYMASNQHMKDEMEDQAVNEMQHMGWLSERLVGNGGSPRLEHGKVDQSTSMVDMLWSNIKLEPDVAAEYDRVIRDIADPGLKELLARIRGHEMYHERVFSDLLKEVQK